MTSEELQFEKSNRMKKGLSSGGLKKPHLVDKREGKAEKGKASGRAKKGKANLNKKTKNNTWSDVVKGLQEDESETIDSVKGSD